MANVKLFREYEDSLRSAGPKLKQLADIEANATSQEIANKARGKAPVDLGKLRASIFADGADGKYKITASANYAAYVEFGTRRKVSVPTNLSEYAAQFKGKGTGDYYDFLNAILDWVKRKGLVDRTNPKTGRPIKKYTRDDNDRLVAVAERIAIRIIQNGIKAQPFLFPSVDEEQPKFFERVKNILNNL